MEWSASKMCEWIDRLTEIDALAAAAEEHQTASESERQAKAVWSETAARAELEHAQKENAQIWGSFCTDQIALCTDEAECMFALQVLRAAEHSIRDQQRYQKTVATAGAEITDEKAKLHFTAQEAVSGINVFAELADAVNQYAEMKSKRDYRKACVRFAAWCGYASDLLTKQHDLLESALRDQISRTEQKTAEKKQEFSERLHSMWEKSRAETLDLSREQEEAGRRDDDGRASTARTEAAVKEKMMEEAYRPDRLMEEYRAIMDQISVPSNYHAPETLPSEIVFGTLVFDMKAAGFHRETLAFLERTYPYLCTETEFRMPLVLRLDEMMNCIFRFPNGSAKLVVQLVTQLVFELLMRLSPKYLHLLRITDTKDFTYMDRLAVFQQLIDPKVKGSEKAIYGSVRKEQADILSGISEVLKTRAEISQNVLKGIYDTLCEHNEQNPEHPAPYTLVTALLEPGGSGREVLSRLAEIAEAGPNCGIFTWIFDTDMEMVPEEGHDADALYAALRHTFILEDPKTGRYRYQLPEGHDYPIFWEPLCFPSAVILTKDENERQKLIQRTQQMLLELMRADT